jgi:hypothetical protein
MLLILKLFFFRMLRRLIHRENRYHEISFTKLETVISLKNAVCSIFLINLQRRWMLLPSANILSYPAVNFDSCVDIRRNSGWPSSGMLRPDDGDSNNSRNICQYLPDYMVQHPVRRFTSYS